jgi:hypothetical protein
LVASSFLAGCLTPRVPTNESGVIYAITCAYVGSHSTNLPNSETLKLGSDLGSQTKKLSPDECDPEQASLTDSVDLVFIFQILDLRIEVRIPASQPT